MSTHRVSYRVLKEHMGGEPARRDVTVCATPGELAALDRDGFLVRESVIEGDWLRALTTALDGLNETERRAWQPPVADDDQPARSIVRHLLDKDAAFHDLLTFPPALSSHDGTVGTVEGSVRARIVCRRRVQDTPWHQHLRVVPNPLPPWVFSTARHRLLDLSR